MNKIKKVGLLILTILLVVLVCKVGMLYFDSNTVKIEGNQVIATLRKGNDRDKVKSLSGNTLVVDWSSKGLTDCDSYDVYKRVNNAEYGLVVYNTKKSNTGLLTVTEVDGGVYYDSVYLKYTVKSNKVYVSPVDESSDYNLEYIRKIVGDILMLIE